MKPIVNESLFELKNIGQTLVEGEFAYFTETQMNQKDNGYETNLYRIHLETKEKVPFGFGYGLYSQLQISPTKQTLSFLYRKNAGEQFQLYCIPLTGGAAVQVTHEEHGLSLYLWGADETSLYYQTSCPQKEKEDGGEKRPQPRVITAVHYQLDGLGDVPLDRLYQVKQLNLLTGEITLVLEQDEKFSLVAISKDQQRLFYNQSHTGSHEFTYGLGQVFVYDRIQKISESLTASFENSNLFLASISPDERHALLVGNFFEYQFVSQTQLYLYHVESGLLQSLTADLDRSIGDEIVADFQQNCPGFAVQWLDPTSFTFSVTDHGRVLVYQGKIDGPLEKMIDQPVHITGGAYHDARQAYVVSYSTTTIPSRLALLINGQLQDIYDPNAVFFQDHAVVVPDAFTYKGYGDWDVSGWYLPPLEMSKNHPAILYIHGGPQVCYGESFFHEMQVLAGQGYGVILLNPRGGSSYGQEFVASILGDYGNHDYDDLMLGLDTVLENHPEIDREKLYVAGGSYGGFMTNWIVGHTDRFRAACTQRCISNWLSFYGTSDIGPFFVENQLQADLTQADKLWSMSPLAYAHQVQTPLLVLHGEADKRCPQEQGEQMYMAMKKVGVPTKLITFPESSHGLSREGLPNLRIERLQAIQEWFRDYQ